MKCTNVTFHFLRFDAIKIFLMITILNTDLFRILISFIIISDDSKFLLQNIGSHDKDYELVS